MRLPNAAVRQQFRAGDDSGASQGTPSGLTVPNPISGATCRPSVSSIDAPEDTAVADADGERHAKDFEAALLALQAALVGTVKGLWLRQPGCGPRCNDQQCEGRRPDGPDELLRLRVHTRLLFSIRAFRVAELLNHVPPAASRR
jgi:hypothetical protein